MNFRIPLDNEELAEKTLEAVQGEWDLIHQNLTAVSTARLKLYADDLSNIRYWNLVKIDKLNAEIKKLAANNPMGMYEGQIRGLAYSIYNLEAELVPVNLELTEVRRAIKSKVSPAK